MTDKSGVKIIKPSVLLRLSLCGVALLAPVVASATLGVADLSLPSAVVTDSANNLYMADAVQQVIVKRTPHGALGLLAGTPGVDGSVDGQGSAAQFSGPLALALDRDGYLYVAEASAIRKISPMGKVTTLAGAGEASGSDDGVGAAARFSGPSGLAVDSSGNVYVADTGNSTIRKISPLGVVTTLAGLAGQSGHQDGQGASARFMRPQGMTIDADGNLYVADAADHSVRKISPSGLVSSLVSGTRCEAMLRDTPIRVNGRQLRPADCTRRHGSHWVDRSLLAAPVGVALGRDGTVYIADEVYGTIHKVSSTGGALTRLPGVLGLYGGSRDGLGAEAKLGSPTAVAMDGSGTLYFTDAYADSLRQVSPTGEVSTLLRYGQSEY